MVLGGTGSDQVKVGIGTSTPATDLDIKQDDASGNERGLKLERADNTDDWRMFIGASSDLGLAFNNVTVGVFNSGTGVYTASSDIRLKKDIEPLSNVLQKIMLLELRSYRFIADAKQQKTLGFVAQEVKPIFPEIVNEREDGYLGLAYDEFGVLAIQAIKEQQVMINEQQKLNTQQQTTIQTLQNTLAQQQIVIDKLLSRVLALEN